ncbi:hypothetical protein ACET3Z_009982 [Daucus carota]
MKCLKEEANNFHTLRNERCRLMIWTRGSLPRNSLLTIIFDQRLKLELLTSNGVKRPAHIKTLMDDPLQGLCLRLRTSYLNFAHDIAYTVNVFIQNSKVKPVHLVDVPGHSHLQTKLNDFLPQAAGVVFVVDAVEFLPKSCTVLEYICLYEI